MTSRRTKWAGAAAVTALLFASACAPGSDNKNDSDEPSSVETDVSKMGKLTLTIWDQEVRGGQAEQIAALNKQFEDKYPNVTIKRVSRSFDDLRKTLRLAITDDKAPDVVQANNGRSDMGQFVKAGLLRSLEPYSKAYGWPDRYPESVRALASYTEDGKTFGAGNLYGLPQAGELVGLWYNKAKLSKLGIEVPTTLDGFEGAIAKAKAAGETPIQFGNLDAWPGIHTYGFVQNQFVPRDDIRNLGFGREGSSWTSQENEKAATTFTDWVDKGYFTKDFNGLGYDPAWQDFAKGKGVFLVAGTWLLADLQKALGEDVGFALPPAGETGEQAVTGGTGLPFAVTEASKHADAAGAYIDFITSPEAMKLIAEAGNLPVTDVDSASATGAQKEVFDAWTTAAEEDALVPYLDYATPNFYDLVTAQIQKLGSGSESPTGFLGNLEKEYTSFTASNGG